jgi:hypothetical protein
MDLNILLTPLYGNGARIESFDSRSAELGVVDFYKVALEIEWQEKIDKTKHVTGNDRRDAVLREKGVIPLHVGHFFALIAGSGAHLIPSKWDMWGCIVFDGCTIRRGDGKLVVPCLRRFKGEERWWAEDDILAERAIAAASAVVRMKL